LQPIISSDSVSSPLRGQFNPSQLQNINYLIAHFGATSTRHSRNLAHLPCRLPRHWKTCGSRRRGYGKTRDTTLGRKRLSTRWKLGLRIIIYGKLSRIYCTLSYSTSHREICTIQKIVTRVMFSYKESAGNAKNLVGKFTVYFGKSKNIPEWPPAIFLVLSAADMPGLSTFKHASQHLVPSVFQSLPLPGSILNLPATPGLIYVWSIAFRCSCIF
jgi:hypothetical protein